MVFIKKKKLTEDIQLEDDVAQNDIEKVVTRDELEQSKKDASFTQNELVDFFNDIYMSIDKLNNLINKAKESGNDELVSALISFRSTIKSNTADIDKKCKKAFDTIESTSEEEKEEVTEAVDPSKLYDGEKVADIISDFTVDFLGTDVANDLEMIASSFEAGFDYTAEQIDAELAKYQIDPTTLESIEAEISQLPDAKQSRIQEFKSDLDTDLSTLENVKDELFTFAASNRLNELIVGLKNIEYDGRPGVVWGKNDWGKGKGTIIS